MLPLKVVSAHALLGGDDHDFIVGMYLAALRRWPDCDGYQHFMEKVKGKPDVRLDALQEIAASPEAQRIGLLIDFDPVKKQEATADPMPMLAVETLQREVTALKAAVQQVLDSSEELSAFNSDFRNGTIESIWLDLQELRKEMASMMGYFGGLGKVGRLEAIAYNINAAIELALDQRLGSRE